jgi:Xaa-Pro aminopeptidase
METPLPGPNDDELSRRLAEAGSALSAAELGALIGGVIAAPEGFDPDAWMTLVAPEPGPALRDRLRALKAEAQAAHDDGLVRGPAPRGRLAAVRAEIEKQGLAGFIVPRADRHHSEFLPRRAERLMWLTGFSGSAGCAVVLAGTAAVFVDGRYTLQAEAQLDGTLFERRHVTDQPPPEWIAAHLGRGARLGYDPWLLTPDEVERYRAACAKAGGDLASCAENPIDAAWRERPPAPVAPVVAHDLRFAGQSAAEKRAQVAQSLRAGGAGACVISAPDSLAWLLNVRGGDVPYCPFPLAFVIVHADARADLFIEARKLAPGLAAHLGPEVAIRAPEELGPALDALARGEPVQADPAATSAWVFERVALAGSEVRRAPDPCALPKACKNPVEIEGARAAHRRDGAALVRFLSWFEETAPGGGLSEIDAVERLAALRRENELYRGPSFPTIAGAGPNGAIVHYQVTNETSRRIGPGELFLIDSGGQYLDGTTDVTRTVAVGAPSDEQRRCFTAVLKGHIAVAATRFPAGTSGSQLDTLARHALWQLGLDYDHGTGHGVGSYLGVHEGPHRISKIPNTVALEPGMICSNEPGYYKKGAFGIRIENLVCVVERPGAQASNDAGPDMLGFETLTRAPIDRSLIETEMLSAAEAAWLDAYHAEVRESLTPLLDRDTAAWLAQATRPVEG